MGGDILDRHNKDKGGSFDQVDNQVTQIRQAGTQGLWKNNADVVFGDWSNQWLCAASSWPLSTVRMADRRISQQDSPLSSS